MRLHIEEPKVVATGGAACCRTRVVGCQASATFGSGLDVAHQNLRNFDIGDGEAITFGGAITTALLRGVPGRRGSGPIAGGVAPLVARPTCRGDARGARGSPLGGGREGTLARAGCSPATVPDAGTCCFAARVARTSVPTATCLAITGSAAAESTRAGTP